MSGPLALAIATAAGAAPSLSATAPEPPAACEHAIAVALPSLDTGRGVAGSYERWIPQAKLSYLIAGEARESAIGDYTAVRLGGGVEARWYWRADRAAWLSTLPAGNMAGWFLALGSYVAVDFTRDTADHKWLGSALQLGGVGRVGYRIVPWRQLAITPSLGTEVHRDIDTSGRLPGANKGGVAVGLDVGWLF